VFNPSSADGNGHGKNGSSGPERAHNGEHVLNGWKQIAGFMGRGVRTVQRWESLGLPVRRPNGRMRSAVIAFSDELSSWLAAIPQRDLNTISELQARIEELQAENAALRQELSLARSGSSEENARNTARMRRSAN
jgi:phage terminase Nu1 subunit (DNA packaging protein)